MENKELIEAHDRSTKICSFMEHMRTSSNTYNEIIKKGFDIIPDILQYLKEEGGGMSVMLLLWDITKESPYQPEKIGDTFGAFNVEQARNAWIKWGINKNYITK